MRKKKKKKNMKKWQALLGRSAMDWLLKACRQACIKCRGGRWRTSDISKSWDRPVACKRW